MSNEEHLQDLIEGNERSFAELNERMASHRMPPMSIDTVGPSVSLLIETLVDAGVLSDQQVIDMQIKLHMQVEEALQLQWVELRNAEARAQLGAQKQSKPRLLGPNGRPV